jgi:hypothetical protein
VTEHVSYEPHEEAAWAPSRSDTEPYEEAVLTMLIQRHRALLTSQLVRHTLGRIVVIGVSVWVSATPSLSYATAIASAVIVSVFCCLWFIDARRLSMLIAAVEQAVSRRVGGRVEAIYIDARYSRGPDVWNLARFEPIAWAYVVIGVALTRALV